MGKAKLTVNQNGDCVLSGKVGVVTFKDKGVTSELGVEIKTFGVSFEVLPNGDIKYTGVLTWGVASFSISDTFNLETLILSCSGLLCRAARALKTRPASIEKELAKAMGTSK